MRKKVLISEDVNLFFELERSLVQREYIHILVAQTGEQALEIARQEHPDLVLLDLDMPEMNGDECCRRIKEDPDLSDVPVMILSHANWEEDLVRARKSGSDGIVLKPINREHFLKTIREILHISDRANPRINARLRVHFGRLTDELDTGYTFDIAVNGAFIETAGVFPAGTPLNISLFLPSGGKVVKCRANVAWINHPKKTIKPLFPFGMGVQFFDLASFDEREIAEYVQKVLKSTAT